MAKKKGNKGGAFGNQKKEETIDPVDVVNGNAQHTTADALTIRTKDQHAMAPSSHNHPYHPDLKVSVDSAGFLGRGRPASLPPQASVKTNDRDWVVDAVELDPIVAKSERDVLAKAKAVGVRNITIDSEVSGVQRPLRPAYGSVGPAVKLQANYFPIRIDKSVEFHQYIINVAPEVDGGAPAVLPRRKRRRLIQSFIENHLPASAVVATDFCNFLYTLKKFDSLVEGQRTVKHRFEDESANLADSVRDDNADTNADDKASSRFYNVGITYKRAFQLQPSMTWGHETNGTAAGVDRSAILQALNIVFDHGSKATSDVAVLTVGSAHFETQSAINVDRKRLGHGLEVLRGLAGSVRFMANSFGLNVQIKYTKTFLASWLPHLMAEYGLSGLTNLEKFLKGIRIEVQHLKGKLRKNSQTPFRTAKTIFGFATIQDGQQQSGRSTTTKIPTKSSNGTGPVKSGAKKAPTVAKFGAGPNEVSFLYTPENTKLERKVTVAEYFQLAYGITDLNPSLPVVNVGSRLNPAYVPAEVCMLVYGQPCSEDMTESQKKAMQRFSVRRPTLNARDVKNLTKKIFPEHHTKFGLTLGTDLVLAAGRILPPPELTYRGPGTSAGVVKTVVSSGSWNLASSRFRRSGDVKELLVVEFSDATNSKRLLSDHVDVQTSWILDAFAANGIDIPKPRYVSTIASSLMNAENSRKQLEQLFRGFKQQSNALLCILPEKGGENKVLYNMIKRVGDCDVGIQTVCVKKSNTVKAYLKGDQTFAANIAHKVNLKLGGLNQTLSGEDLGVIHRGKTMVVGIDVIHPSAGSSTTEASIVGMVATVSSDCAHFPGSIAVQSPRVEIQTTSTLSRDIVEESNLVALMYDCLQRWQTNNQNTLPNNILVYRDGVSEGQFSQVVKYELKAMRDAYRSFGNGVTPKFTVVICGKRHNTRFYPTDEQHTTKNGNPIPGTLVDRNVTEAQNWTFYLQSHGALAGTAKPCRYDVVHDEIFTAMKK